MANHALTHGWSLSGLSLTVVFPTCGLMHVMFVVYATTGQYHVGWHGLVIGWLAVPAAIYFPWVVRNLSLGTERRLHGGAALQMPDLDGWATLASLRAMMSDDVPVVVCSAKASVDDLHRAWQLGCDGYIKKPFDNPLFVEEVRAVLARSPAERRALRARRMFGVEPV